MSLGEAVVLATLTSAFPWIMSFSRNMAFMRAFLSGMRLRCAYSGLIFRKVRNINYINKEKNLLILILI